MEKFNINFNNINNINNNNNRNFNINFFSLKKRELFRFSVIEQWKNFPKAINY